MVEFILCKTFGWTIMELYAQPFDIIQDFLLILNEQNKIELKESQKWQQNR